jgi:hydrogenase maturation protease
LKILLLGIGNGILCDDAVGLIAARELKCRLKDQIDVMMTEESGLSLLDFISGYDRVIILDAIKSGRNVGDIVEVDLRELYTGNSPSRHFLSIPEVALLGDRLGLDMPDEIRVVAMEVADPYTLSEEITTQTASFIPALVQRALNIILAWQTQPEKSS